MNNHQRMERMRERLEASLQPVSIDIEDQSHLHRGHPGARDGRGHFALRIVSKAFAGKNPLQRHRMVYAALGEMMQTDIHALTMKAYDPEEPEE